MSQENLELVQRGYELFSRGDIRAIHESIDEICQPDVELRAGRHIDSGPAQGREALKDWYSQLLGAFDFKWEPEEFIDTGDAVVVIVRQVGRGKASGAEATNRIVHVFGFRQGKVTYIEAYGTKDKALEAVGLRE